jgi:hypothetical protein
MTTIDGIPPTMTSLKDAPVDNHRPSPADMRAVLATARAILLAEDEAAHDAASAGTCAACTTMAAVSFGFALASTMAGEKTGVSPQLARVMLAAVNAAEAELRGSAS